MHAPLPSDSPARTGPATRMRLDTFDARLGFDRGRSGAVFLLWHLTKSVFFLSAFPWPQGVKHRLLRLFGARVGRGVVLKPRVNIHFPWKLRIGDHAWIGEEVFLLNFESIAIGAHACVSQRAFLCAGNHDYRQPDFRYRNAPITVGDGAWIGAQVFVAPGVTIPAETVVTAGSVVVESLPPATVCSGNPCRPVKPRWRERKS